MFKQFVLIAAVVSLSNISNADTGETKTFSYNGSQKSERLDLRGELTHTEHKQQQVASTCYRQVFSHYSSVCHSVPRTVCDRYSALSVEGILGLFINTAFADDQDRGRGRGGDRGGQRGGDRGGQGGVARPRDGGGQRGGDRGGHRGGDRGGHRGGDRGGDRGGNRGGDRGGDRGGHRPGGGGHVGGGHRPPVHRPPVHRPAPRCRTVYHQECRNEAQYRTESYTCYKTQTVSYQVKDADVLARVSVEFGEVPAGVQPNDTFKVSVRGKEVALSASGDNKVVYFLEKSQKIVSQTGNLVETAVDYKVSMLPTALINAPVSAGLSDLTVTSSAIRFTIGQVSLPNTVKIALALEHEKALGDDKLLNRQLRADEYTLTTDAGRTTVEISVAKLGLKKKLADGKFEIDLAVSLAVDGQIANPSAISKSKASKNVKLKLP